MLQHPRNRILLKVAVASRRRSPSPSNVLLVLDHLLQLVVQRIDLLAVDVQLRQPAFVIGRHRSLVVLRVLHVIKRDIPAENRLRVRIRLLDRRASEADERCPRRNSSTRC